MQIMRRACQWQNHAARHPFELCTNLPNMLKRQSPKRRVHIPAAHCADGNALFYARPDDLFWADSANTKTENTENNETLELDVPPEMMFKTG